MFEDSLFASKAERRAARSRWAAVIAVSIQGLLVAGLLLAPMMRPLALPLLKTAPPVVNVSLRKPEIKTEPVKVRTSTTNEPALRSPASPAPVVESRGLGRISVAQPGMDTGPVMAAVGPGMGMGVGSGPGIGSALAEAARPVVRIKSSQPPRISSGVSSGMLLAPIRPVYPAIARAAGVSGTVVVAARIDKAGRITGAQVVSGPGMLRSAALDAIAEARYRPYLLNGEATEVETMIVVNFKLGG